MGNDNEDKGLGWRRLPGVGLKNKFISADGIRHTEQHGATRRKSLLADRVRWLAEVGREREI